MSVIFKNCYLLILIFGLIACGGGGSKDSPDNTVSLGGSAVKGPLANALVEAYLLDPTTPTLQGQLIDTGSTNSQAAFSGINLDPAGAPYLIVVTADADTIDITTNAAPVITSLQTIVSEASLTTNTPIYATPLTSMAVAIVASQADTSTENIQAKLTVAQNQVKTTLGFGLDETLDIFTTAPLLTDETETPQTQQATAEYRLAIEALSAVLVDIADETDASDDTPADVLAALASDLADGVLDGMADGEMVGELAGYDVTELDDIVVSNLTIPGTNISVDDIEQVLTADTDTTGAEQELADTIDVSGEPPILVADTDLDTIGDDLDNCPAIANTSQSDTNSNGFGDVCDAAPVIAQAIEASVNEDGSVSINLSQGVSDAENDELSYAVNGQTQDGPSFLFTPDANFNGETSFSFSVSDGTSTAEGTVNVTVSAQNDPGSVAITGTASQGELLTAVVEDAIDGLNNASISYEWSNSTGVILGETQSTLLLAQNQVGETITVSASYTDDEGFTETVASDSTEEVADVNDAPSGQITLNGVAREDETVSVDTSSLSDIDGSIVIVSYQWSSDGSPITDATFASFSIPADLVGSTLSVEVTFSDDVFTGQTVTQSASFEQAVANANDPATGTVVVSNTTPQEDDVLVATVENLQDEDGTTNATFTYQWLSDGALISGASTSAFSPTQAEVGTSLSVQVSFTDDLGSPETLTSAETNSVSNLNDDPEGSVNISGSTTVGSTLTATNSLTDEDGLGDVSYEWFLDGASLNVFEDTYTTELADIGSEIVVVASYQDSFGVNESVSSSAVVATEVSEEGLTSLIGSWDFHIEEFGTYDKTILTFTEGGEFFFFNINSNDDDTCRSRGYENGTYEVVGDEIQLSAIIDTNGCVGIFDSFDGQTSQTLTILDQETTSITLSFPDTPEPFVVTATRIQTNADSIVGSWHEAANEGGDLNQGNNLSNLVLFLGDGRFYSMDVDFSESPAQDNSFNFGDYTFDLGGAGLSLTRRFDSVGEFTLDEAKDFPNADIVNNELFINSVDDQFGIGRVSPDADSPSAPLAFTQEEFNAGFTFFFPAFEPEDCGDAWVIEEVSYDAIGYSLDFCGLGLGDEEDQAYQILSSGMVRWVDTEEYMQRVSFDPEIQAYRVCYGNSELEASDCAEADQAIGFLSLADAQAYTDEQNAGISEELPIQFTAEWLAGRTIYDAWYGREDGFQGDDARLASISFSDEGTNATWFGIDQSNIDLTIGYTLDNGSLYFGTDEGNRFTINPCGSTSEYLEILYTENGVLDNIDRFYFNESDALAYVDSLTGPIPQTECEVFTPIDMTQNSASSVITFSECPSDPLGWDYSFTGTTMTLTGSDGWQTPACTTSPEESFSLDVTGLASDFDIPFNCAEYPICTSADFNKTLSGVDEDNRAFTSTYSYNPASSKLTYVSSKEGTTFTEIITITPELGLALTYTTTEYTQGELHTLPGSSMQCDSGRNKSIGDIETISATWTRDGNVITEVFEGFEDEPETHVLNSETSELAISYSYFEQDPTGEQGDEFTDQEISSGTVAWSDAEQAFVGSITTTKTLSWTLDSRQSICIETASIRGEVRSGSGETFLE